MTLSMFTTFFFISGILPFFSHVGGACANGLIPGFIIYFYFPTSYRVRLLVILSFSAALKIRTLCNNMPNLFSKIYTIISYDFQVQDTSLSVTKHISEGNNRFPASQRRKTTWNWPVASILHFLQFKIAHSVK